MIFPYTGLAGSKALVFLLMMQTESVHGTDVKSVECELQIKDTVNSWCCANNIVIGIGKTKCMLSLMGSKQTP